MLGVAEKCYDLTIMNILIIGNGGREHALAWKVAQSPRVEKIWVAPGNAGTARELKTQNVPIGVTDIKSLIAFAKKNQINLTLVGPEIPLAAGIVDHFQQENLIVFGPTQAAAQLETSKSFCKTFMRRHGIPTARFEAFRNTSDAFSYLEQQSFPIVIKASGLAAGKGVVIAQSLQEAKETVIAMMEEKQFGNAGAEIVIEEFLAGEELSFIAMVDGEHILPLAGSQDHKRRDDGDRGPNTGGMGAYSPVPQLSDALQEKIMTTIMQPTVTALKSEGILYRGFLYAGIMITLNNEPKVLEFNVRLGDPETQPLMMRLRSDLIELILSALSGRLNQTQSAWDSRAALTVVLAAGGYPAHYQKGDIIQGLDQLSLPDVKVFHAGTQEINHQVVTDGGRVLGVTALGKDLREAQQKAYQAAQLITWPNCYYRHDIGHRAIS
ncbi:phosphoribosylamine--glycine ligase [Coxiella burnetii RSA 493]|uniref:Phosphoribosylamine--glycine ligase n=2 Tax=Coxiella burnetii (strain RSA 493 / Nine Mile phase I) TaxID=227377 RepID=Q83EJ4_COXBU|nr:phosphoribosylamine--glycine ligase [Coxiella burnetii RSA 493]ARI65223.1 phosphoribosylamine--glycine ligase [Coxiella burnetii]BBL38156.1 phosphoribosylamine--glycine ligase [Coxiella burnetii]